MPLAKISITVTEEALTEIDLRSEKRERSPIISRDLERYYYGLAEQRRQLREMLTDGELGLILDCCNGTLFREPFSIRALAHGIKDGIQLDQLDTKWEVDGQALLTKLESLSFAAKTALVDAVERWWIRVGQGELLGPKEALV